MLGLDTKPFERALSGAKAQVSKLGQHSQQALRAVATGFTVATAAAGGLTAAVLKTGAAYNTLMQSARAAFTTILGTSKAADSMISDLEAFARTSPFPRQAFVSSTQQLLAFGMEAERVIPTLDAVQNAVAASGGSTQQLSEVVFVLAQIQAAGKITATDLMQLGQRGIDAATLIGSQMGMTGAEIRDAITAGTLDARQALDALALGMHARFGGAADGLKSTWTGAVDRIKGALRDLGSGLAEPFISKQGGGRAVEWANRFADALRHLEATGLPALEPVVTALADRFGAMVERATDFVMSLDASQIGGLIGKLQQLAPAVGAVSGALLALGGANLGPLSKLLPTINPILGAIIGLVAATPELQSALVDLAGAAVELAAALGPAVTALMRAGSVLAADVAAPVIHALAAAIRFLAEHSAVAGPAIMGLVGAIAAFKIATAAVAAINALKTAVVAFQGAVVATNPALLTFTAAVGVAVTAVTLFTSRKNSQREAIKRVEQALIDETGALNESSDTWNRYINEQSRFESRNQLDDLDRMGVKMADLRRMVESGAEGLAEFARKAAESGEVSTKLADEIDQMVAAGLSYDDILDRLQSSGAMVTERNFDVIASLVEEQKAMQAASEEAARRALRNEDITDSQFALAVSTNTAADGTTDWIAVLKSLTPLLAAAGKDTDQYRVDVDVLRGSLNGLTGAAATAAAQLEMMRTRLFGVTGAEASFRNAIESTSTAVSRGGGGLRDRERDLRAVESAQKAAARATEEMREAEQALADALTPASAEDKARARLDEKAAAEAVAAAEERLLDARQRLAEAQGKPGEAAAAERRLAEAKQRVARAEQAIAAASSVDAMLAADAELAAARKAAADAEEALQKARDAAGPRDVIRAELDLAQAETAVEQAKMRLADATRKVNEVENQHLEGSKRVLDARRALIDAADRLAEAQRRVVEAEQQLRDEGRSGGGPVAHRARSIRDAYYQAAAAAEQWITKLIESNAPQAEVQRVLGYTAEHLRVLGAQAGLSNDEIDEMLRYLSELAAIKQIEVGVKANLEFIARPFDMGQAAIDAFYAGFRPPGRAKGGPVRAGQPYIVGEEGPEPFIPTTNGFVIPNDVWERLTAMANTDTNRAVRSTSAPTGGASTSTGGDVTVHTEVHMPHYRGQLSDLEAELRWIEARWRARIVTAGV